MEKMCAMKLRSKNLKKPLSLALIFAVVLLGQAGIPNAYGLEGNLHGSFKTFFLGTDEYGLSDNTLRLQARLYPTDKIIVETAYSLSPQVLAQEMNTANGADSFLSVGGETGYRAYDFDEKLYPEQSSADQNLAVYHNLDRMYGSVYLPFGDLYLGRQAISWGSAHVINPTDIIAPYSFSKLNTEEKGGVDAVRLRIPVGGMSEIDLGYVAGDEFSYAESALFARTRLYAAGADMSLLVMDFQENLLIGGDVTRSIGGAGSWIEAAYVLPEALGSDGADAEQQYTTVSAGIDYNFGPKLYGYAEYHFNSPGKNDPSNYTAYTEGSIYLQGRHYAAIGGTYQLTPLIPVSGMVLMNITDISANFSLNIDYNFTKDVYISGGCYLGAGESQSTEFAAYPDLYYVSVKLYF
ncbi:MAG: hypothetical protein U5P10_11805 [Spirochaetia bacterium]|nr:hypothetical protein [Spirochaetia bacterium]